MTTPVAPPEMRPLAEVQPVVLDGVRVFRHVVAHGDDLLTLESVDNTKWVECDLSGTNWPSKIHEVTLVDCDLRDSVWNVEEGENIKIFGTKRIRVSMTDHAIRALNLDEIAARVDGMKMDGNFVGLAMVRVGNE